MLATIYIRSTLITLLLFSSAVAAQPAAKQIVLAGQTYAVVPIEVFAAQLREATAGDRITHRQTAFAGALLATASGLDEIHATIELTDVYFIDAVSFAETVFRAPVQTEQVVFASGLSCDRAHFTADFALRQSQINGHASFRQARFDAGADFAETRFGEQSQFGRAHFAGPADFSSSEGGTIRLGAYFAQMLDLSRASFSLLDLEQRAGIDSTFGPDARLHLHQPRFGRVQARWDQLKGRLAGSDDLDPAYAALRHHFRIQGLEKDAENCQIERLERQRLSLSWGEPKRWALELWNISSNYGSDPQQLVFFILTIILLFGLGYRLQSASMQPAYGEGEPTLADCIGFSIYTFTHAGYRAWYATGHLKLLASVEALLGWISLGLLIAVALAHLL